MLFTSHPYVFFVLGVNIFSILCGVSEGRTYLMEFGNKYLTAHFNHLILPIKIELNILLLHHRGILFYGIDNKNNQLIIRYRRFMEWFFIVTYKAKEFRLPFSHLCSCKFCKYQRLNLMISIDDEMKFKCNNNSVIHQSLDYFASNIKGVYLKNFPIPYEIINSKLTLGQVWFIGIPLYNQTLHKHKYDKVYEYVTGCIYKLLLNDETLEGNKFSECNSTCNAGNSLYCEKPNTCLEYLSSNQLRCNCKTYDLNGQFCNESLPLKYGYIYKFNRYKISKFKLTVNCSQNFTQNIQLLSMRSITLISVKLDISIYLTPENNIGLQFRLVESYVNIVLVNDSIVRTNGIYMVFVEFNLKSIGVMINHNDKTVFSKSEVELPFNSTISLPVYDGELNATYFDMDFVKAHFPHRIILTRPTMSKITANTINQIMIRTTTMSRITANTTENTTANTINPIPIRTTNSINNIMTILWLIIGFIIGFIISAGILIMIEKKHKTSIREIIKSKRNRLETNNPQNTNIEMSKSKPNELDDESRILTDVMI